ncbi:hypothetical protein KHA80_04335 [Anaerobacillus sp. HL2]|nr:hypothetical protein KHA80_04335 [Anaerobacillus sp. HL2]
MGKNVRVTPLAVANMLTTIARGGEKKQVRGASKLNMRMGQQSWNFSKSRNADDRISKYTAMRLQELLRAVVKTEQGTAYALLHKAPLVLLEKLGQPKSEKIRKERSHWFAGYFPSNNPKYVMVIIDLDHQNGNFKTLKAYEKIAQFLQDNVE